MAAHRKNGMPWKSPQQDKKKIKKQNKRKTETQKCLKMLKNFCLTLFLLNEQIHMHIQSHIYRHTDSGKYTEVLGEGIKKMR